MTVICTEAGCAEEFEVVVADLEEVDRIVCECGYCVGTVSVAAFEPLHLAAA